MLGEFCIDASISLRCREKDPANKRDAVMMKIRSLDVLAVTSPRQLHRFAAHAPTCPHPISCTSPYDLASAASQIGYMHRIPEAHLVREVDTLAVGLVCRYMRVGLGAMMWQAMCE
jgi:hypothetical protein